MSPISTSLYPEITPQESLNRPVSGSDFGFEIPLRSITGSEQTLRDVNTQEDEQVVTEESAQKEPLLSTSGGAPFERKFLHQMSSGFGTQQYDSRGKEMSFKEQLERNLITFNYHLSGRKH